MCVVVTWPKRTCPSSNLWSPSWGTKRYERNPTQTCDRSWLGLGSCEALWDSSRSASHEWLGSFTDTHVLHWNPWCILDIGFEPCRMSTFPDWRITFDGREFGGLVEYVVCVLPTFYCRWGYHLNIRPQNNWWMLGGYHPSSSWKWLERFSSRKAWPATQKNLPEIWRQSLNYRST